ncbi:hypothetical protein ACIBSW_22095 [Actinoplanes sp. NPDC049668]|uniref:hypothetical protein n=1 Tax=unclassified Actinoplanes TaxID=2626549 RepID=UPI0033B71E37
MSSPVFDVVIAVVLTLWLTSLVASAIVEWVGNLTRKRAKYLLRGLRNMLDATGDESAAAKPGPLAGAEAEKKMYDKALTPTDGTVGDGGLTALCFDHPVLRAMMQPRPTEAGERTRVPPYVPADMFSRALLDTLVPRDGAPLTLERVRAAVAGLNPAMPARQALLGIADQSAATLDDFRAGVEHWYDAQMDRVSGWYKRWAKRWLLVVAALLCLAANIDAYAIAGTLYRDPALRAAVVGQVQQGSACADVPAAERASCVRELVGAIDGTGRVIWWPEGCPATPSACVAQPGETPGADDWLIKLLGLALTAAAAAVGAPFWFDLLNRLVNLRATGPPPKPKP